MSLSCIACLLLYSVLSYGIVSCCAALYYVMIYNMISYFRILDHARLYLFNAYVIVWYSTIVYILRYWSRSYDIWWYYNILHDIKCYANTFDDVVLYPSRYYHTLVDSIMLWYIVLFFACLVWLQRRRIARKAATHLHVDESLMGFAVGDRWERPTLRIMQQCHQQFQVEALQQYTMLQCTQYWCCS